MNVTITTDTPIPAGTTKLASPAAPTPTPPPTPTPTPVVGPKPIGYRTFYQTAKQDTNVASGTVKSTQAVYRYEWGDIETAPGVFNFAQMDADYAAVKAAGQQFNFTIMPWEDGGVGPMGLKSLPGFQMHFGGVLTWQPNLDSLAVQADLDKLLAGLGARYAANTATVSLGWFGPYGEWSNYNMDVAPPLPSLATLKWLIAEHQKYFPSSYVIVQEGLAGEWNHVDYLNAAMDMGAGVEFDSWHSNNAWQENEHAASVAAIQARRQWLKAPIVLEPWDTNAWTLADWQAACDWAANTVHAWAFTTKENAIPQAALPYVQQLIAAEKQL
jgi:hypothetical protein